MCAGRLIFLCCCWSVVCLKQNDRPRSLQSGIGHFGMCWNWWNWFIHNVHDNRRKYTSPVMYNNSSLLDIRQITCVSGKLRHVHQKTPLGPTTSSRAVSLPTSPKLLYFCLHHAQPHSGIVFSLMKLVTRHSAEEDLNDNRRIVSCYKLKWFCSQQRWNLLDYRIELSKVWIPKMGTNSGIELPYSWITLAFNHDYDGTEWVAIVSVSPNHYCGTLEKFEVTDTSHLKNVNLVNLSLSCT